MVIRRIYALPVRKQRVACQPLTRTITIHYYWLLLTPLAPVMGTAVSAAAEGIFGLCAWGGIIVEVV
jgi:hypothetical protein